MLNVFVIVALAFSAPGDIYRCVDANGKASFQDKPCAGQPARAKGKFDGGANDTRDLRVWLERMRRESAGAADRSTSRSATGANSTSVSPSTSSRSNTISPSAPSPRTSSGGERLLAACSERFLACANGDEARMDACVARVNRCTSGSSAGCCPSACIARYQALRKDGNAMATSVKGALLDPDRPSCAE